MTSDSQHPKHLNKEEKASKKLRKTIRNIGRHRELKGAWKIFADSELVIFFLATLAVFLKLFGLSAFIMSLLGLVVIVKKEIRIKHEIIYGTNAVIIGLFLTVLFWIIAIWYFFS